MRRVHYRVRNKRATCPYPEPEQPTPHPPTILKNHSNIILPYKPRFSKVSPFQVSPLQPRMYSLLPHTRHVLHPSHPASSDHPDHRWGRKLEQWLPGATLLRLVPQPIRKLLLHNNTEWLNYSRGQGLADSTQISRQPFRKASLPSAVHHYAYAN